MAHLDSAAPLISASAQCRTRDALAHRAGCRQAAGGEQWAAHAKLVVRHFNCRVQAAHGARKPANRHDEGRESALDPVWAEHQRRTPADCQIRESCFFVIPGLVWCARGVDATNERPIHRLAPRERGRAVRRESSQRCMLVLSGSALRARTLAPREPSSVTESEVVGIALPREACAQRARTRMMTNGGDETAGRGATHVTHIAASAPQEFRVI